MSSNNLKFEVNYSLNNKIISFYQIDDKYQLIGASINDIPLTTEDLLELLQLINYQEIQQQITSSNTSNPSLLPPSSSLLSLITSENIFENIFDEIFVTQLRNIFFDFYDQTKKETLPFIPILISIEGNIGAGKSKIIQSLILLLIFSINC